MVLSLTHCSIPNMMKVPPSMMNPAGKMAFTPQIDKYFPTRGPLKWRKLPPGNINTLLDIFLPNMKSERWMMPNTAPNSEAVAPLELASMG